MPARASTSAQQRGERERPEKPAGKRGAGTARPRAGAPGPPRDMQGFGAGPPECPSVWAAGGQPPPWPGTEARWRQGGTGPRILVARGVCRPPGELPRGAPCSVVAALEAVAVAALAPLETQQRQAPLRGGVDCEA
eukprot:9492238-Pyramimonas_sp.AAC.1